MDEEKIFSKVTNKLKFWLRYADDILLFSPSKKEFQAVSWKLGVPKFIWINVPTHKTWKNKYFKIM